MKFFLLPNFVCVCMRFKLKYPSYVVFILAIEFCERFTSYGLRGNTSNNLSALVIFKRISFMNLY